MKLADLGVSLSYPIAWGKASTPQSLKTSAGIFKTVSFAAFATEKTSIDLYYYSSDYKPTVNTPYPASLTPPTCASLASSRKTFGIQDCAVVNANGKTIVFFQDIGDNSFKGWLYTGNAKYPVLEIVGTKDLTDANRETFEKVLTSVK